MRGWRPAAAAIAAALCAGCGAGRVRPLEPADVSPALAGEAAPFEEARLGWVETGVERYDRFFREAAALQGAILLAERALAGERAIEPLLPVLAGLEERAAAALADAPALVDGAPAAFAHDEAKATMIGPVLHEAVGQLRDAAARGPALLARLRARLQGGEGAAPASHRASE